MAGWVDHAIFWHVFPLGFVGAEHERTQVPAGEVRHRLHHLTRWLAYVVELGCSGLLLAPVFESSSHGYDTLDYRRIDPRLGDESDFEALVQACQERGLRLVLDGVFNHVGHDHPAFTQALAEGEGSEAAKLFQFYWESTDDQGEPAHEMFEGHPGLVTLNHESDAVVDLVTDVMCYWLAKGIDGWRLDAAYAVPTSFWHKVIPRVREQFPDAYIFGEVLHGDYAAFVREADLDAVTEYELWKATWSSIDTVNFHELVWTLGRHNDMLDSFVPQTFIGNHDVTRVASQIAEQRHHEHAFVILLTVGGTPSIYYGDEQGYTGVKEQRAGGDDQVRPVMPESPDQLSDLGRGLQHVVQELIALRRRHPWLHRARTQVNDVANGTITYVATGEGGESVRVGLNLTDEPFVLGCDDSERVLAGHAEVASRAATVPPHRWVVLGQE